MIDSIRERFGFTKMPFGRDLPAAALHQHADCGEAARITWTIAGRTVGIITALGGRPAHGTAALAAQAWGVLAGEAAERGRTPVLVIDEAHLLDHQQLESIRLMTNHDMDSSTPFATVLSASPPSATTSSSAC
jgi:hypothetical protein